MARSRDKAKAAEELLHRKNVRKSIKAYVHNVVLTLPGYQHGRHIDAICDEIDDFLRSDDRFLLLTCPPRHMKSTVVSECLPAWTICNEPQKEVVVASYNMELAKRAARSVRIKFEEPEHQRVFGKRAFAVNTSESFTLEGKLNGRPNFIAAGIGTGLTGSGADLMIIDDPIKDPQEAYSTTYRENTWRWFTQVAFTRLSPNGKVIIILTRWHHDDLAGRLIKLNPPAMRMINYPAISVDGEPLWPERYPLDVLLEKKAIEGERAFNALYQGNPSTEEGDILKREWWQFYQDSDEGQTIQSWDTAFKTGEDNDYSVCWTLRKTPAGIQAIDMIRGKWEYPEMKRMAVNHYHQHSPSIVLIEDKASGQSIIQDLRVSTDIPIKAVRVDKDKEARVRAISHLIEGGRVFLPSEATWTATAIEECAAFPSGEHDDIVDALSQGLAYFSQDMNSHVLTPATNTQALFDTFKRPQARQSIW